MITNSEAVTGDYVFLLLEYLTFLHTSASYLSIHAGFTSLFPTLLFWIFLESKKVKKKL